MADLNYPDHFIDVSLKDLEQTFDETGITLNGLAMRYYSKPGFKLGAFTHPDASIRRLAINETKKGIDTLSSLGGNLMTLWMGQDGVDYSFQGNYEAMWDWTIQAITEIADRLEHQTNKKTPIFLNKCRKTVIN